MRARGSNRVSGALGFMRLGGRAAVTEAVAGTGRAAPARTHGRSRRVGRRFASAYRRGGADRGNLAFEAVAFVRARRRRPDS